MLKHWAANRLWTAANRRHARRLRRAERNPRRAQSRLLGEFLRGNADTVYGRAHGYGEITSIEEFRERVPLVRYEELEPWIERILAGEADVLTREPVVALERTSGSSGPVKYIPYTGELLRQFQRAVGAWMHDLYDGRRALLGGSHYWSLTPLGAAAEATESGIPLGLRDDTEYFGRLERWCLRRVIEAPPGATAAADVEECLAATARHLATCRDLRFISVWCPSFLVLLAESLPARQRPCDVWPELQLISCWAAAESRRHLARLRELFPGVEIQGKGLLATEGVVSIPRLGAAAPVPALTAHFLEFIDDEGNPHLADELETGRRYAVAITTGGGFARYLLGDRIEVDARGGLEFVGRAGNVSDLCGEKLSEGFVRRAIGEAAAVFRLTGVPFLAPEWGSPPRYLAFVEGGDAAAVARWIEGRLRQSHHYDYCRSLRQLGAVEGVEIHAGARRYLRGCESLGQRAGDVKATCLRRELGWRERMTADARR